MVKFSAKVRRAAGRLAVGTVVVCGALASTTGVATAATATAPFVPAGYVSQLSGVTSATLDLHLKVPTITCTAKTTAPDYDSAALYGPGGGGGTEVAGVTVSESCSGLVPSYSAIAAVDNSTVSSAVTVAPGDVVNIAIVAQGNFETASFGGTGFTGTFVNGVGFSPTGAAVDVQGGTGSGHFPKFTTTNFSAIKLDGKALSASSPVAQDQTSGTVTQISVSALNPAGTGFAAKYVTNK
jgi:hypothetical protein